MVVGGGSGSEDQTMVSQLSHAIVIEFRWWWSAKIIIDVNSQTASSSTQFKSKAPLKKSGGEIKVPIEICNAMLSTLRTVINLVENVPE